jgi:crotonobetainyl-CoA:carnitine CoA-transferase CaiB-like acyl-CoA transferase
VLLKSKSRGWAIFTVRNRGKESLSLNLKTKPGKKIFLELLRSADVVIESFRPGRLKKLGFDYKRLRQINKRIILCSITGYGQSGPYAEKAGHDLNYLSLSGLLNFTGTEKGPNIPGFQSADMVGGGLYGALAILAALQERNKTGRGTWIDLSMTEAVMTLVGVHLTGDMWDGMTTGQGKGLLNGGAASYQIYGTRDARSVALAALEPKFWESFKSAISLKHASFSGFDPSVFSKALRNKLSGIFLKRTLADWMRLARRFDMCLTPVRSMKEVLRDPHFVARKIFSSLKGPRGRKVSCVRSPLVFDGRRLGSVKRAPSFGEHNGAILRQLGYDIAAIRRFKKDKVI